MARASATRRMIPRVRFVVMVSLYATMLPCDRDRLMTPSGVTDRIDVRPQRHPMRTPPSLCWCSAPHGEIPSGHRRRLAERLHVGPVVVGPVVDHRRRWAEGLLVSVDARDLQYLRLEPLVEAFARLRVAGGGLPGVVHHIDDNDPGSGGRLLHVPAFVRHAVLAIKAAGLRSALLQLRGKGANFVEGLADRERSDDEGHVGLLGWERLDSPTYVNLQRVPTGPA